MDPSGDCCLSVRIDRVHRPIHHSTKQEEKPFLRLLEGNSFYSFNVALFWNGMLHIVKFFPVFKQQRYTRAWSILNLLLGYGEDSRCVLYKYVEIHLKYTNDYQKFDWKLESCYSRIEYRHCINKVLTEVFFWISWQSLNFSKNSTFAKCQL